MAICFARMEYVKRSKGKCVVAKAAYNAKTSIYFEGNQISPPKLYDWSKSQQPISHSILLPKNVNEVFKDPRVLWNSVEKAEKRKDSQVGKEIVIALPDDNVISNEQRIEMAEEFAKIHFVSKGYGIQVDVHHPKTYLDINIDDEDEDTAIERNFHAHILVTERPFDDKGQAFFSKKINHLGPQVRGSMHATFDGIEWKKLWTQFQNEYFEAKGLDLRVDSQGLVLQIHLGPMRMRTKRANEILGEYNKREELGQLLALDPTIILKKLTETKSVFQKSDLEFFLQKYVSEQDREKVQESFWNSHGLIQLFDKDAKNPTTKFTSVEVYEEERKILRLADKLYQKQMPFSKDDKDRPNLNEEQNLAFKKIVNGNALACIEGFAGTGKSYLLVALKNHYENMGYKVRAFGPDNSTVKVLEEKGFNGARSVHSILYKNFFSKKNQILENQEIWIIDEASKLGNRPLLELLKLAETNNIRLIFSGNSAQLSSVDRGGLFSIFCKRYEHIFLQNVQRQNKTSDREISKHLAYGEVNQAIDMIASNGGFQWSSNKENALLSLMEKWAEDRVHFPYDSSLIVAHTNQEVRQLNDLAHTIRMARGEISAVEFECHTTHGKIRISEGDLIEFRQNSKDLDVKNGDKGILVKASEKKFIVKLKEKEISFDPQKFSAFQLGYALTYFRSQGDTVHRAYIAYSPFMSQKLLYVGRTRHVKNVHCFVAKTEARCITDIKKQMIVKKELENTLNYTTIAEIEKNIAIQNREKKIQELCSSESVLLQTKGYSTKIFDYVKAGVHRFLENRKDKQLDKKFYGFSEQAQPGGRVILVKEEDISLRKAVKETSSNDKMPSSLIVQAPPKQENSFQKLPLEVKNLYKVYFEKSGIASSLHTLIQSEVSTSSLQKKHVPSFGAWQIACGERNEAANNLLKRGVNQKGILGEKGYQMLRDRAEIYNQPLQPHDSIQSELLNHLEGLLHTLFPEGPFRKDSRGFRFGSKGSLAVTCVGEHEGHFYSFQTKEKGNLIGLIKLQCGLNTQEAIIWAKNFLKESGGKQVPSQFSTKQFSKFKEDKWTSVIIPDNEFPPELNKLSPYIASKYRLAAVYQYCTIDGQVACYNLRLEDKEGGKKIFLPLSYGKSHTDESPTWRLKGYSERSELLYNAPLLKQFPNKPVLIVEGEKTADSAQKILDKDYVVVSWQGGASAAGEANWKLLSGRNVVIWPDNDIPGFKAASDIADCLRRVGVKSLKVIDSDVLKNFPVKWDLADPLPEGMPNTFIESTLLRAENKAISCDRLVLLAGQYNIPTQELNDIVADIDKNLRPGLEEKNGSKTWETESAILAAVSKYLEEKDSPMQREMPPHDKEKILSNEKSRNIEMDL
jgi:Ti-type conjugative transfer relaxase TraA